MSIRKNSTKKIVSYILISILLITSFIVVNNYILFGEDKIAYDLISSIQADFKDPSSVEIVSGSVATATDNSMFARVSAINGFGARGSDCYLIMDGIAIPNEAGGLLYEGDELNIMKINRRLAMNY